MFSLAFPHRVSQLELLLSIISDDDTDIPFFFFLFHHPRPPFLFLNFSFLFIVLVFFIFLVFFSFALFFPRTCKFDFELPIVVAKPRGAMLYKDVDRERFLKRVLTLSSSSSAFFLSLSLFIFGRLLFLFTNARTRVRFTVRLLRV